MSFEFNFSADQRIFNRQTYSVLDWMGDMGGLVDAFFLLGQLLIAPISGFALQSQLLSALFRYRDSYINTTKETQKESFFNQYFNAGKKQEEWLVNNMKQNYQGLSPIKKRNYYSALFCCRTKYKKLMIKSQSSIGKELDLRKFIYRQRLFVTAILGLLSGRQSFFVDKMSQLMIRESSNLEETSSDAELSDWGNDDMHYVKRMFESSNKVDKRFIDMYKIRKAHQLGIHFGHREEVEMKRKGTGRRNAFKSSMTFVGSLLKEDFGRSFNKNTSLPVTE